MKNKNYPIRLIVIVIVILWISYFLISEKNIFQKETISGTWVIIQTGETQNLEDIFGQYEKTLITNKNWYPKEKKLEDFPKIKINNPIKDVKLIAEIAFTDEFIKKYAYEDSKWYFFGLKFFLGDFDGGGYYNVYRKQNWWVWNSYNHNLVGAKLAYQIKEWTTWYITLNNKVPVAVEAENRSPSYQFWYLNMEKYISENVWKEIYIGVYLSSVSELKWWELTRVKSLKIIYTGKEWDVEIIE